MVTRLFTDRAGGVSKSPYESFNLGDHVGDVSVDVDTNRALLQKRSAPLMFMNQVHGNTVVLVEGASNHFPTADAMITAERGIGLVVLVADCIPVLMWDEDSSVVAAVHVGRRGLLNGITFRALEVMRELGSSKVYAEFGPSICGKCYEVGEDVFREVVGQIPSAQSSTSPFKFALDLPSALATQLEVEGVIVSRSEVCTCESKDHFSYRRDGITGRNAGVIWI